MNARQNVRRVNVAVAVRFRLPQLVLLGLCVVNAQAQIIIRPTDRNLEGLQGPVKNIQEEVSEIKLKNGKLVESSRRHSRSVTFDRLGRKTREWASLFGSDSRNYSYSYDKVGNQHATYTLYDAQVHSRQDPPPLEQQSLRVFSFDPAEITLSEDVYVGDEISLKALTQKYKYRLSSTFRLMEKISYTPEGVEVGTDVYDYGTDLNPTQQRLATLGNPLAQTINYSYTLDPQGNWIKRVAENVLANPTQTTRLEVTYRKISYY